VTVFLNLEDPVLVFILQHFALHLGNERKLTFVLEGLIVHLGACVVLLEPTQAVDELDRYKRTRFSICVGERCTERIRQHWVLTTGLYTLAKS
jgi:hypothetical protein